ncbi:MAG: 23S rRNA (pseudouridine(1915)-N(3))-methyltransferase RlmH [Solirubrobacterales bacterium]
MRLVVITVGKSRPPFADDLEHYGALLGRQARLEQVELAEGAEAAAVLRRVPKGAHLCALDREGEAMPSERLAEWLAERRMSRRDLAFVVGGPFGLDRAVLEGADSRLSFGPMTLPHQLARVVLLEQLFRAHKILAGEAYHY